MAYVYILESEQYKRFYIGSTGNLEGRLVRHNQGYVKATRPYRPYKIVFQQQCPTLQEARFLELKIKKWKRRDLIEKVIASGEVF